MIRFGLLLSARHNVRALFLIKTAPTGVGAGLCGLVTPILLLGRCGQFVLESHFSQVGQDIFSRGDCEVSVFC